MCGIAGLITPPGLPVDIESLKAMRDVLTHRGPDDNGYWVTENRGANIGFAHQRLSILDHEGGYQPMVRADKQVAVVFNGQIYNHVELRSELLDLGHEFKSDHSDTEVLLHGYAQWGPELLPKLNGMFAFAALDKNRNTLCLARGPMGQKPLYVATKDFFHGAQDAKPFLAFSSELQSLTQHPQANPQISPLSVSRFLAFDFVPDPDCIYQNVYKVPPGHHVMLDLNQGLPDDPGLTTTPYWDLCFGSVAQPTDYPGRLELLRQTLAASIQKRMVADVPLGVFLSGGIDSSLVAALATEFTDKLQTFSIAFEDPSYDESNYAQDVANHLGTQHHVERLNEKNLLDVFPTIADHLSEPFADHSVVPTYLLSQFCRKHVTVALGGDGGDELFLGYPTFVAEKAAQWIKTMGILSPNILGTLGTGVAKLIPVSHDNMPLGFKLQQFSGGLLHKDPLQRHQRFLTGMDASTLGPLIQQTSPEQAFLPLQELTAQAQSVGARDVYDTLTYGYSKTYLSAGVLQKVDRASMAVSLETRAPMMDKDFVRLALSFQNQEKLKGTQTKAILKDAAEPLLPSHIIHRPKKGFGMPVASWLGGPLRPMVEDLFTPDKLEIDGILNAKTIQKMAQEHFNKKRNHRKTLWAVLMYQWWRHRVHPKGSGKLSS